MLLLEAYRKRLTQLQPQQQHLESGRSLCCPRRTSSWSYCCSCSPNSRSCLGRQCPIPDPCKKRHLPPPKKRLQRRCHLYPQGRRRQPRHPRPRRSPSSPFQSLGRRPRRMQHLLPQRPRPEFTLPNFDEAWKKALLPHQRRQRRSKTALS